MNELRNPLLEHFHYPEAKSLRLRMMELVLIQYSKIQENVLIFANGLIHVQSDTQLHHTYLLLVDYQYYTL